MPLAMCLRSIVLPAFGVRGNEWQDDVGHNFLCPRRADQFDRLRLRFPTKSEMTAPVVVARLEEQLGWITVAFDGGYDFLCKIAMPPQQRHILEEPKSITTSPIRWTKLE